MQRGRNLRLERRIRHWAPEINKVGPPEFDVGRPPDLARSGSERSVWRGIFRWYGARRGQDHIAVSNSDMVAIYLDKISGQTAEYALLTGQPRVAPTRGPATEIAATIRPCRGNLMAFVITQPCEGVKDASCVEVCPVDCIHTDDDAPMYYINPDDCIDCAYCVAVCPVSAIFDEFTVPPNQREYVRTNRLYFAR